MQTENCRLWVGWTLGVIYLFLPSLYTPEESTLQLPVTAKPCSVDLQSREGERFNFPPKAQQVARIIGAECDIARLSELAAARITYHTAPSIEELWLRQNITDAIVIASLNADTVLSEIDYEQRQIDELIRLSQVRRDRALGTTNLAILTASTGLGIVAGALSINNATSDAGDALAFASGGISTLFSIRGLRQSKEKGHAEGALPTMLEPFFAQPGENHRHYPDAVWAYLNNPIPGEATLASRKVQLLGQWVSEGRLPLPGSLKSQQRIALLTTNQAGEKKLDVPLLAGRSAMLADVGHAVAQMKSDLAELLRGLM